jgi:hypothetical protein
VKDKVEIFMTSCIYDKTQKGREEITTRKHQLSTRMRSLLVLIDGKQTETILLQKINGLGLDKQHLQSLLDQEFIQITFSKKISSIVDSDDSIITEINFDDDEQSDYSIEEINTVLEESQTIFQHPEQDDGADINTTSSELRINLRIELLRKFLTESIEEYIGFKGFFILRKVKKAKVFEDFHSIRNPFILAILRKLGKDKALELRDEFDQMLYSKFSVDFPEFLDD